MILRTCIRNLSLFYVVYIYCGDYFIDIEWYLNYKEVEIPRNNKIKDTKLAESLKLIVTLACGLIYPLAGLTSMILSLVALIYWDI